MHYDNKILLGFCQIADHVRSLVTPSLPTYWDKFDAEWDATKANAVSNPQYLSALLKYSESHRHRRRRNAWDGLGSDILVPSLCRSLCHTYADIGGGILESTRARPRPKKLHVRFVPPAPVAM